MIKHTENYIGSLLLLSLVQFRIQRKIMNVWACTYIYIYIYIYISFLVVYMIFLFVFLFYSECMVFKITRKGPQA